MSRERLIHITRVFILGLIIFGIGFFSGKASIPESTRVTDVANINTGKPNDANFELFWKAWNTINDRYVTDGTVTSEEKMWGAIKGLADSLGDPYTVFFPPEENQQFEEMINGSFGGVGMEIGEKEGTIVVIAPLKGTPAEKAGIRSGDFVASINGTSTAGLNVDEAVDLIRGEPGTSVILEIAREGEAEFLSFTVIRDTIVVPTLDTETKENTFIISLYNFDALASTEFRKAMGEFAQSPAENLLLDLRGNPGGFLDAAVDIASYFVPAGEVIVSEHSDGNPEENTSHLSKGFTLAKQPKKMAILIDGGSASASEIVAGALHEHDIAKLIGTQSFGKGSVQELIPLSHNTALKMTIAKWLTPKGTSISDGGLTPDIVVEKTADDITAGKDPQLDAALKELGQ